MIEARGLTKTFRRGGERIDAVRDLTLSIASGEFVGFLGPNGAGKSTTIKMMTGILRPSGGSVTVAGLSPERERVRLARQMGVVFGQRTQLWWDLPLLDSFRILRAMYRVAPGEYRERMERLDALLSLSDFLRTPVRQLSLGQRMRGELAGALLHRPAILFLDEPTIGLDVTAKAAVRGFLREENRAGTTVILTTHDMTDVEELCHRIVVVNQGAAVFDGNPARLAQEIGLPSAITVTFRDAPRTAPLVAAGTEYQAMESEGRVLEVQFNRARRAAPEMLDLLRQCGEIVDFTLSEPALESAMRHWYDA